MVFLYYHKIMTNPTNAADPNHTDPTHISNHKKTLYECTLKRLVSVVKMDTLLKVVK